MRRLGYDLSQARLEQEALNLGIEQSVADMTQAEKSQLRYIAIMTQVTQVQSDMSRTLDAPANQLRILQAQLDMAARAIGNIFIPALNAILPYAIAVVQAIREIANAVASLFGFEITEVDYSGLEMAAGDTEDLASGMEDAASAAKDLAKYTLGFDELNVLDASTSSGTGTDDLSGSGFEFELPEYDFLGDAISGRLDGIMAEMQPVVDWLKENFAEILEMSKDIATAILAWNIASTLIRNARNLYNCFVASKTQLDGWAAALRIASGLIITITSIKFAYDAGYSIGYGEADLVDIAKAILAPIAAGIGGAIIGSAVPGIGTAAGFLVGLSLGLIFEVDGYFKGKEAAKADVFEADFWASDIGQSLSTLKERIEAHQELNIDLTARINTITGEIDSTLLADLSLAQTLIDDIFRMTADDNMTQVELALLQSKIETLNGLNIDGLQLEFNELTGEVSATKDELQNVIDNLLKQYQMEALKEAYIDAYREQYSAIIAVEEGTDLLNEANKLATQYQDDVTNATIAAREAFQDLYSYTESHPFDVFTSQYWDLRDAWQDAEDQLTYTKDAMSDFAEQQTLAEEGLLNSLDAYDQVTGKMSEFEGKLSELVSSTASEIPSATQNGADIANGIGAGLLSGESVIDNAMTALNQSMLDTQRSFNEIASPSKLYESEMAFVAEGMANGLTENTPTVIFAMENLLDKMLDKMETFTNLCRSALNDLLRDFARSMASVEVSASGMVSYDSISSVSIPRFTADTFADGGFPTTGELFIAREAGAEMVGSMGGKTTVANNDQIVAGIKAGVYEAVVAAMSATRGNGNETITLNVTTELDGQVVYANQEKVKRQRGATIVSGAFAR